MWGWLIWGNKVEYKKYYYTFNSLSEFHSRIYKKQIFASVALMGIIFKRQFDFIYVYVLNFHIKSFENVLKIMAHVLILYAIYRERVKNLRNRHYIFCESNSLRFPVVMRIFADSILRWDWAFSIHFRPFFVLKIDK